MQNQSLRLLGFLVITLSLFTSTASADQKLKVTATIFPLYDFAREVGGEKIDVNLLLPPGVEAHAFEPKPQDVVRLNKVDVFLFTGQSMEPWAMDILKSITNKNLLVVDSSKGITLLGEAEDGHRHAGKDPHIWLDPVLAQTMVDTIALAFSAKDELNSEFYLKNAENFKAKLMDLDARYATTLSSCEIRTIIYAGHSAFAYLAKRYGFEHVSPYNGFSPNAEPAPKSIKKIIDAVKQLGANVVYYEELIDPRVAKIVTGETGVRLELLHGVHNISKSELSSATYLGIMESNLLKLKDGLQCK